MLGVWLRTGQRMIRMRLITRQALIRMFDWYAISGINRRIRRQWIVNRMLGVWQLTGQRMVRMRA
jgi:hypothetical protein